MKTKVVISQAVRVTSNPRKHTQFLDLGDVQVFLLATDSLAFALNELRKVTLFPVVPGDWIPVTGHFTSHFGWKFSKFFRKTLGEVRWIIEANFKGNL